MSSRSRGLDRGVKKVRKARTVVMVLLVMVAVAIILIDRGNREESREIPQQNASPIAQQQLPEVADESIVTTQSNNPVADLVHTENVPQNNASTISEANNSASNPVMNSAIARVENPAVISTRVQEPRRRVQTRKRPRVKSRTQKYIAKTKKQGSFHVVRNGDSLSKIAKLHYGSENSWAKIARANKLSKNSILRVGQKLTVPTTAKKRLKRSSNRSPVKSNFPDRYTVRKGDSLFKIAKTFGVRVAKIYELNRKMLGNNPHRIKEGQSIRIPNMASMNK